MAFQFDAPPGKNRDQKLLAFGHISGEFDIIVYDIDYYEMHTKYNDVTVFGYMGKGNQTETDETSQ